MCHCNICLDSCNFSSQKGKSYKRSRYGYAYRFRFSPPDFRNLLEGPKLEAQPPLPPYLGNKEWWTDWVSLEKSLKSNRLLENAYPSPLTVRRGPLQHELGGLVPHKGQQLANTRENTQLVSFELQYFPKIDWSASSRRAILVACFSHRQLLWSCSDTTSDLEC